jgi:hypothetical protein
MPPASSIDFFNPFQLVTSAEELKEYVESSDYYADLNTIQILGSILKLNIIPIQKNKDDKLSIPYTNLDEDIDRYLFLFYLKEESHYELITFNYKVNSTFTKTFIFEKDDKIIPPFYILFLLFSTYFLKLSEPNRQRVLLKQYLEEINDSYIKISNDVPRVREILKLDNSDTSLKSITQKFRKLALSTHPDRNPDKNDEFKEINNAYNSLKEYMSFFEMFNKYFQPTNDNVQETTLVGGNPYNPYTAYNPYNLYNPYNTQDKGFLKKTDESNLSFYITIELYLQKGKTLSDKQIGNLKCVKGWNKVRKSFSEFTGQKYVIPPIYEPVRNSTKKNGGRKLNRHSKTLKK